MKTPDMAKENNFLLREAAKAACDGYYTHLENGGKGDPAEERWIEALTAGADAITQVAVLESRLAQVERERDALYDFVKKLKPRKSCINYEECLEKARKHSIVDWLHCPCCPRWEWRGVCAENTKEAVNESTSDT